MEQLATMKHARRQRDGAFYKKWMECKIEENEQHNVVTVPYGISRDLKKLATNKMILFEGADNRKAVAIDELQKLRTTDDTNNATNKNIKMNYIVRHNLDLKLGDVVSIQPCKDIKPGTHIRVSAVGDTVHKLKGNFLEVYLLPYFRDVNPDRPVHKGDSFIVHAAMHSVEFKIMETSPKPRDRTVHSSKTIKQFLRTELIWNGTVLPLPKPYCIVSVPGTVIQYNGSIKREDADSSLNKIGYHDIDCIREQLAQIKAMVEYH
ncbi:unnamed protein product [Adineta steineri]|nr:unnamed protein product [Adineta steineri]